MLESEQNWTLGFKQIVCSISDLLSYNINDIMMGDNNKNLTNQEEIKCCWKKLFNFFDSLDMLFIHSYCHDFNKFISNFKKLGTWFIYHHNKVTNIYNFTVYCFGMSLQILNFTWKRLLLCFQMMELAEKARQMNKIG